MEWGFEHIPGLSGKVIIVTGGNSGLGYESAKAFAAKGAEVIMACRSLAKGEKARGAILKDRPDGRIELMQLDLGDLESVRRFADSFRERYRRLDVLLNNAGIMMTPYFKTKEGFEGQFGTNHLGHFALTGLLLDLLLHTDDSRVVNVSSIAHKKGDIDFDNLQFEDTSEYTRTRAYQRSKLANLLFTYELQRKLEKAGKKTISVAAHPGVAMTNLASHLTGKFLYRLFTPLFRMMLQSQAMGALPQIRASVDPGVKGGQYYGPGDRKEFRGHPVVVSSTEASHDQEVAARLWAVSEKLTKIGFDFEL